VKALKSKSSEQLDLNSPKSLAEFRKAAKAYTERAVQSQATARQVLIDEGIYTKSGKLSKRYS
jgi:hypothetical protein